MTSSSASSLARTRVGEWLSRLMDAGFRVERWGERLYRPVVEAALAGFHYVRAHPREGASIDLSFREEMEAPRQIGVLDSRTVRRVKARLARPKDLRWLRSTGRS